MNKKTLRDVNLKGKSVLMRVDFNVPIKNGVISDDTRVQGALNLVDLAGRRASSYEIVVT